MACHHEEHMHDHVCWQSKMLKQRKQPKVLLRGPRQPRQPRRRCSNQTAMFGPLRIASVAEKATQIGPSWKPEAAQPSPSQLGRLKFQERPEKKSCFAALGCTFKALCPALLRFELGDS